jgi:hypothetical protein
MQRSSRVGPVVGFGLCAALTIFTIAGSPFASVAHAQEGGSSQASAGRDKSGFFIKGDNVGLSLSGYFQARATAVFRDAPGATDSAEDIVSGFSMRRTRLTTTASLTDTVKLKVELSADNDGQVRVIDGFATFKLAKETLLDVGAFKGPGLQEFHASDTATTFAEKSTLNALFNQGRSDGVMLTRTFSLEGGALRLRAGINDGLGSSFSDFDSNREADFATAARIDWTNTEGDFSRFSGLSGFRGGKTGWLVGAAVHAESGGETAGTTDRERTQLTADGTYLGDGWSLFVAGVYRTTDTPASDFADWGLVAQAGYFVTDSQQVAARITFISPDGDRPAGDEFYEVGLAYNYFLLPSSHAHKLIADISWASNQADSGSFVTPNTGTNLQASEDDQVMLRVQYQVMF